MKRGWEVFRMLTWAELRQSREFSLLGFIRWVIEPLSYMVVYLVLISGVLGRRGGDYPLFLLAALIPFRYFTGAVSGSLSLMKRYSSVITNHSIPKFVLPFVLVAAEGATFVLALALLLPIVVLYGFDPWPELLFLPLVLTSLLFLIMGPVFIGSVFGVYQPDLRGAVQNLLRVTFLVSTGLLATREFSPQVATLVQANPLSGIFDSFRAVLMDGAAPQATDLLYPAAVGGVLMMIGIALFRSREREFAKEI